VSKDYHKERRADGGNGRKQLHRKRATNEHDYLYCPQRSGVPNATICITVQQEYFVHSLHYMQKKDRATGTPQKDRG
jgi:hypothetical protein